MPLAIDAGDLLARSPNAMQSASVRQHATAHSKQECDRAKQPDDVLKQVDPSHVRERCCDADDRDVTACQSFSLRPGEFLAPSSDRSIAAERSDGVVRRSHLTFLPPNLIRSRPVGALPPASPPWRRGLVTYPKCHCKRAQFPSGSCPLRHSQVVWTRLRLCLPRCERRRNSNLRKLPLANPPRILK